MWGLKVIDRLRMGIGQKVLVGLIAITLFVTAFLGFFNTQSALSEVSLLTSQDRPHKRFAMAETKALLYVRSLEKWSFGAVERRDVEIARVTLTQVLTGNAFSSIAPLQLASPGFLSALKESDAILDSTVPGLLPTELQKSVQTKIGPVTEQIISQSERLVDDFQEYQEAKSNDRGANTPALRLVVLFLLFVLLIMFTVLVIRNARIMRSNFDREKEIIRAETEKLNLLFEKLTRSETTVVKLQELSEAKSAFIENVNHELRTPLSSVIGHIDIIRDLTASRRELGISNSLEVLDRNTNILLTMADNILSLSRLESESVPLSDTPVDISQVIDDCILVLQGELEISNIEIKFSIDREVGYLVEGDVEQLSRVVLNLLSNAIKFSKVNSHIDIEVDEFGYGENLPTIRIFIRDYGIGIPTEDIGKVFTRFYRASNAREKQVPGTGLGLAIVDQIVHLHGGIVEIESVEGEGTTMIVILPKHLSPVDEMVHQRRHAVLVRAISELEESSQQDLPQLAHTMGGLIGFYTFEDESKVILGFSNWLDSTDFIDPIEMEVRREAMLTILKYRLASLPHGDGANE